MMDKSFSWEQLINYVWNEIDFKSQKPKKASVVEHVLEWFQTSYTKYDFNC